jgi:hypothetical protein
MNTQELVKYYDGFVAEAGHEVSEEAARKLPNHAKAFFSPVGALDRIERYSHEKLSQVDYLGEQRSDDDIKAFHLNTYTGTGFAIRRKRSYLEAFIWEDVHAYTDAGGMDGFTLILLREDGPGLMEINLDQSKRITGVTKYHWESRKELRYVFEYSPNGRLVSVYDLVHGDHASFDALKQTLPDPQFFERGLNLPKEIAQSTIPM